MLTPRRSAPLVASLESAGSADLRRLRFGRFQLGALAGAGRARAKRRTGRGACSGLRPASRSAIVRCMRRLALALVLSACGGAPPPPSPVPAVEERSAPAASVACWEGDSRGTLPTGQSFPAGSVLVRRTVDEAASRILEDVVQIDGRPGQPPRRYRAELRVDGARFTVAEASGAFEGSGTLEGEPWRWTRWSSRTELPDGGHVVAEDAVEEARLRVVKRVHRADGELALTLEEDLAPLSPEECDERFRAIEPLLEAGQGGEAPAP